MPSQTQHGWSLTGSAFERLLGHLGDAPAAAAQEYVSLRRKLVLFFAMRGAGASAESLADEAIDRLARRLEEGPRVEQVRAFVFGVARRLWLEDGRRRGRQERLEEGFHDSAVNAAPEIA